MLEADEEPVPSSTTALGELVARERLADLADSIIPKYPTLLGISEEEAQRKFGHMLEAFKYGAPPHGGIALGFDRLCAILCGTPSIRDVIAFPKTAKGTDLMTDSPGTVEPKQLRELHLELKVPKKE